MIITVFLTVFLALIMGLFGALPSIPPMPTAITDIGTIAINFVGQGTSVLSVIFSPALLNAAIACILAMIFFSKIYFVVLWVLKKIPLINIK